MTPASNEHTLGDRWQVQSGGLGGGVWRCASTSGDHQTTAGVAGWEKRAPQALDTLGPARKIVLEANPTTFSSRGANFGEPGEHSEESS